MKGKCVIRSITRVMRGKYGFMEVDRGLRNSILLRTLTLKYGSETWTRNRINRVRTIKACMKEVG